MNQRFSTPIVVDQPLLPDLGSYYNALMEAYHTGKLSGGVLYERLEATLKARLGAANLLLCANGTLALMTALCSLPLSGEVITPAYAPLSVAHAITLCGLLPVFADVDAATGNLDPLSAQRAITAKTSGIVAAHMFGAPCDVKAFDALSQKHGLYLIYDASHAFGVQMEQTPVVRFGHASALSFNQHRLFHTGEGGAVCFNSEEAAAYARMFCNLGMDAAGQAAIVGLNARMSEMQAAMGLQVLERVEEEWRTRMRLIQLYRQELEGVEGILLPKQSALVTPSAQVFAIRIGASYGRTRDETAARLAQSNVFAQKGPPLAGECAAYGAIIQSKAFPQAELAAAQTLVLPLHGSLSDAQAKMICEILRRQS